MPVLEREFGLGDERRCQFVFAFAEIGQVLRHRSPNTTEIYAKVDLTALRDVARPWPGTGGAR